MVVCFCSCFFLFFNTAEGNETKERDKDTERKGL